MCADVCLLLACSDSFPPRLKKEREKKRDSVFCVWLKKKEKEAADTHKEKHKREESEDKRKKRREEEKKKRQKREKERKRENVCMFIEKEHIFLFFALHPVLFSSFLFFVCVCVCMVFFF